MHIYVYTYIHIYIYTYTHILIYTQHIYIYIQVSEFACVRVCVYVCVHRRSLITPGVYRVSENLVYSTVWCHMSILTSYSLTHT